MFKNQSAEPAPNHREILEHIARKVERADVLEGLHSADSAFAFAAHFHSSPGSYLWLCQSNREVERIARDLNFFLFCKNEQRVLDIPNTEENPYRGLSPHPSIASKRALSLWRLLRGHQGFVVTTLTSLASRIPAPLDFLSHCIDLQIGKPFPLSNLIEDLWRIGYVNEDPVSGIGEFSNRGGIVDIFSPNHQNPVRVEFFGDKIESIRHFDTDTQRSTGLVPSCELIPMREIIPTDQDIKCWHKAAPKHWDHIKFSETLAEKLQFSENGELFSGFEYNFPLVIDNEHSLFEFFPPDKQLRVVVSEVDQSIKKFEELFSKLHSQFQDQYDTGELVLPPGKLFFSPEWIRNELQISSSSRRRVFFLRDLPECNDAAEFFDFKMERKYQGRVQEVLSDLSRWKKSRERAVFVMSSRVTEQRLIEIFSGYGVVIQTIGTGIGDALKYPVSVLLGKLSEGFYSTGFKFHILTQGNIFGENRSSPSLAQTGGRKVSAKFFSSFRDLRPGDCVVHIDHGIGVFSGLRRIEVQGEVCEFVELVYRDDDKVYVPINRLDLIQKYSSAGETKPRLNRLGGVSWEKIKSNVKKSTRRQAKDLLKLYARRKMAKGYAFSPDDFMSREFEEAFEYEETRDQLTAINDIKSDMESDQPMDRLICGDVGYGKTEVAMRAAFKTIRDSKQVALLAPTTILAFQHFRTFQDRFNEFPVRVGMVSRLQSSQQQKEILKETFQGRLDVLIGTHRILSKDVHFRDLGLVIIDEEQRFGVIQKEKLKSLKAQVEVLALSATPIPRTLNMSLIGLRDLSFIQTPPRDRLAIQTMVVKFNRNIIRSAIDLELKRKGQVLFVHNTIDTIHSVARMVQEICPQARVVAAHGQMKARELEGVMLDFLNYHYDVLVATTIVENGLDIPRANTLIVNRADRFGLAQLYQLRGRVGRSNRRAYAYFLIPSEETLEGDARKRLSAIKEFSDLGAGFRLAALDLEIRGAGNLLGGEQHGHINAVGFELYMRFLEQTIRELKGEELAEDMQTNIDLRMDIQVPEHYINNSNLRLGLYKHISSVSNEAELDNLREEIVDRFGQYPSSVVNLFEYAKLRLRARQLRVMTIDRKGEKVFFKFREDTPVSSRRIVELISRNNRFSLNPTGILSAKVTSIEPPHLFDDLHALLEQIAMLK